MVTFVQPATGQSAGSTTSASATFGAATTSGNLLVLVMGGDKNTGALTATGWTEVYSLLSTSVSLYVWWKVSTGETSVSVSWATTSTAGNMMWVGEYSDAGSGSWAVVGQASNITDETNVSSKTTGTTGTLTGDGMSIAAAAVDSSQSVTTVSAWGNSYATRYSGTGGTGRGAPFVAELAVTAGTTTSSTFSYTGTADQVSAAVAVFGRVSLGKSFPFRPTPSRGLIMRGRR